ncbi:hypothetical protein NQ318_011809 [Aromia moschata]|uniref:F-box domain-containing protein n=1 Tax=Aromia moschata TaxID=1265417 RepID=A0AAV8Y7V2_9CUCU|nr:hypothetical protein NQ318_011809 [Aromia moschata]
MFQLLPIYETSCVFLQLLPVELCCIILRYLDPRSLLASVRAHKSWTAMCRGDPVLRQRLRSALREERELLRKTIIDPRVTMTISRDVATGTYRRNVKKSVTTKTNIYTILPIDDDPADRVNLRKIPACSFNLLPCRELYCITLRYLDPRSLLASVRAHKSWIAMCRGDPVLRQRLRSALREERELLRKTIIDPRVTMTISRDVATGTYRRNVKKSVTTKTNIYTILPIDGLQKSFIRISCLVTIA